MEDSERSTRLKESRSKYLQVAVRNQHQSSVHIVRYLVEDGANINLKDKDGRTALHHATQNHQNYGTTF